MIKKTHIILFVLLLSSCRQVNNDNNICYGIDIHSGIECVSKQDIVEEVKYVALKTADDFLISYIRNLFFSDSLLFIVDTSLEVIFVYDMMGNPLYKIGNKGQAPGEYVSLSNVTLDNKNRRIIVGDVSSRKIISYDFSGNLIDEKRLPDVPITYFTIDPSSEQFIGERRDVSQDILIVFDDNKTIADSYLKLNSSQQKAYKPYQGVVFDNRFFVCNDTVFYLSLFDYSIYSFSNGNFNKEYCLNIPDKFKIADSKIKEGLSSLEQIEKYKEQRLIYDISSFIVTSNYISFMIWGGDFLRYNILYNRNSGISYFYDEDLYSGDKDHSSQRLLQPPFLSACKDYFVFHIYYVSGLNYLREHVGIELEDDCNPVLCFVKLKKDW